MGFVIVLIVAVIALFAVSSLVVGLTFSLVGLLLTVAVAGLIGWAADAVVPGKLPGGWLGAVLAGIAGGFLGNIIFGLFRLPTFGLELFDVRLLPTFIGALVIAGAAELMTNSRALPAGSR